MSQEYIQQNSLFALPVPYGKILLYDDCEELLKFSKSGTGSDYNVTKDNTLAFTGSNSLKIVTRATTPAANDTCRATRTFPLRSLLDLEFLFNFRIPNGHGLKCITFGVDYSTYYKHYEAFFRYNMQSFVLQYQDANQTYQNASSTLITYSEDTWYNIRCSFSLTQALFKKISINNTILNISTKSLFTEDWEGESAGKLFIEITSVGANQATCYFDNILCLES